MVEESRVMGSGLERGSSRPLKLNGVEQYMHADHRRDYPIFYYHVVALKASFSRQQLEAVIESVSRSDPRVTALLARGPDRRARLEVSDSTVSGPSLDWVESDDPQSESQSESARQFWESRHCLPRPAVRFLAIRTRGNGAVVTRLFVEVYHALFDGLFTLQYMGEIIRGVLSCSSSDQDGSLRRQASLDEPADLSEDAARASSPGLLAYVKTLSPFLGNSSDPLVRHRNAKAGQWQSVLIDNSSLWPIHGAQVLELRGPQLRSLKIAAAKMGSNLNGLLMAAIFCSIRQFWEQAGSRNHRICFCIPVSLRSRRGRLRPVNSISYVFLRRSTRRAESLSELAQWATQSLALKSTSEMAQVMTNVFELMARSRVLLPLVTRFPGSMSTVIVSNVGNINQAIHGSAKLRPSKAESPVSIYTGITYLRPGSQAGFGISELDGNLTISGVFDTLSLAPADCEAVMNHLRHRLAEVVAGSTNDVLP
ncbi:hypothetical protein [Synechococcus sp. CBW1004]|jgi:hypothetical protein|uniref:hypothetical protein n=1 Tax=Synechococcus sp. CBW1004 TaxID=1353136 RepID=UPI0018CDC79A|nr:hypothetical protein [Synechococcus sp. CBW1004]QPN62077.1 hypothetical protein H8F25_09790 [Synechococcus sp. CBW1004]